MTCIDENFREKIKSVFELGYDRKLLDEDIENARFNLQGFALTLLKMKMEEKYGSVEN